MIILGPLILPAQKQVHSDTPMILQNQPYENKLVRGCDTISRITSTSMKMEVSGLHLPEAVHREDTISYSLPFPKKKGRSGLSGAPGRALVFSYAKERGNMLKIWLNGKEKHCFGIKPGSPYSFNTYYLDDKTLEVYGKIYWTKYYRNFRLIFYFNTTEVLFDFDDEILKGRK